MAQSVYLVTVADAEMQGNDIFVLRSKRKLVAQRKDH